MFGKLIAFDEAVTVKLVGNVFTQPHLPHAKAHQYVERFLDDYRNKGKKYGDDLKVGEYAEVVYESLIFAGMSKKDAYFAKRIAREQRLIHGISDDDIVPRIGKRVGKKI